VAKANISKKHVKRPKKISKNSLRLLDRLNLSSDPKIKKKNNFISFLKQIFDYTTGRTKAYFKYTLPKQIVFKLFELSIFVNKLVNKLRTTTPAKHKTPVFFYSPLVKFFRYLIQNINTTIKTIRYYSKHHFLKLIKLRSLVDKTKSTHTRNKLRLSNSKLAVSLKTHSLLYAKIFIVITILSTMFLSVIIWIYVLKDIPSPQELTTRNLEVSTKIYDRNGILLYKIYKDQNRTLVKLDSLPKQVILATLAIEDNRFYDHPGFSTKGIVRATYKNLKNKQLTGGSTITQQLVKNALLSSEKTFVRKLREVILAIQVEYTFSKDEILEMYLNEVSYGGTAYGIQEASKMYFNKNVEDLTMAESALLAGLPRSPSLYSPFGSKPQSAITRQKQVLHLMESNGFISETQRLSAENEKLAFAQNRIDIKAPHFVMMVKENLENRYGKELVEKGGLEVTTTLDYKIQLIAEKAIVEELDKLKNLNVSNAAAVVMDPRSGEILAMVGSKNYFDSQNDGFVNVTTSLRQPGSSIKPINYAYALSNGLTPATIISDTPITFNIAGQPPYTPRNYDSKFRGDITIRSALAESRNIPAVKILSENGVGKMIELGKNMGITTWNNPDNYGLSLTLGGGEVKLIDLTKAYATLANYGKRPELLSIKQVKNYKGRVLEENVCDEPEIEESPGTLTTAQRKIIQEVNASESVVKTAGTNINCKQEQVVDPRVAFMITDILKDNEARSPAFGPNSMLVIPNHKEVAAKTGTSNNLRDNLTVGYNQYYVVAVWVGNNDNSPMSRIASGVTGAAPIFNKIMSTLLAEESNHDWEVPEGLVRVSVCPQTGTLGCPGCNNKAEWFLEEKAPTHTCSSEWFKNENYDNKFFKRLEDRIRELNEKRRNRN
jgi:1A family penicillin-binding protein